MFDFYLHPVFWLLCSGFFVELLVYLFLYGKLAFLKFNNQVSGSYKSVSVIIAAKNEDDNLRNLLPVVCEQDYPDYEVIVVNDQSWDDTRYILDEYCLLYPHLKVVTVDENVKEFFGKKFALTLGFKAAKNEILLLTDADCIPTSKNWISLMQMPFSDPEVKVVLGYSPYTKSISPLNFFIQYETTYTALLYFSWALAGKPYMGVGRNLAYTRELFFSNKGFAPYLKMKSGDDDLFINTNATGRNTRVQLNPESHVFSKPKSSISSWWKQKRRHMQTGKLYKGGDKTRLTIIWLCHLFFYASVALCAFFPQLWIGFAGILFLWFSMQLTWFWFIHKKLGSLRLWLLTPFIDVIYQLIYLPIISLIGIFSDPRREW